MLHEVTLVITKISYMQITPNQTRMQGLHNITQNSHFELRCNKDKIKIKKNMII